MWYQMPTGRDATREAAVAELGSCLAAVRCVVTLLSRNDRSARRQELARMLLRQLRRAERLVRYELSDRDQR